MAGNGKIAAAGLGSILVVAMVVAAVVISQKSSDGNGQINTSNKAADALCTNTDYKETCHKSLEKSDSDDPKKLMQTAFEYTVENIEGVVKESKLIKDAAKDKSTQDALHVCEEVLNTGVEDLKRAFQMLGDHASESNKSEDKSEDIVEDLKTWLSAVRTYQETCIDAFEKTQGETAEQMKELLKTAKELTSNALAMVDEVASLLRDLDIEALKARVIGAGAGRRLLDENEKARVRKEPVVDDKVKRILYDFNSPPSGSASINAVVAQDGTAQYKTINDAVKVIPSYNNNTFVIYIKTGVYNEEIVIPKYTNKVVFLGEGPDKTKITASKSVGDGTKTFFTATVGVNGDDFVAKDIGFENSAGPTKQQGVALRITGDRAVVFNCHINGYQDSLYAHTYRQFYRNCRISGAVNFVFGDSRSIFQNCTFAVKKPGDNQVCSVTSQGRVEPRSEGAFVIQGSSIVADPDFLTVTPPPKAYLGRPWKELSRTIVMQTNIDALIAPEGWTEAEGGGTFGQDTCYYAEFQNKGPGADTSKRVTWKGIQKMDPPTAEQWTPGKAFGGDVWITNADIPYDPGMMK